MKLIESSSINTQEDLLYSLKELGFDTTQATISRDIKELRLSKVLGDDGLYKYVKSTPVVNVNSKYSKIYLLLKEAVVSVDIAINIIVVKCYSGMAQAVCSSIDGAGFENIVGTIAGDDTIFLLFKTEKSAGEFLSKFNNIVES